MLLLTISSPVYADDPCEGAGCDGDCGMEVNIGVSDNSEVNVNTGDNSEVELNTGACNDVLSMDRTLTSRQSFITKYQTTR